MIRLTAHELGLDHGIATWIPDRDLAFGLELYSILFYCPAKIVEAARMSLFVESLLADHNLNTLVASTLDKVSGLKSILRVVLPAGALPISDLPRGAVSESNLIFSIITQPQQPAQCLQPYILAGV